MVLRVTTDRLTADEAILLRAATAVRRMADRTAHTTRCLPAVMEGHPMVVGTTLRRRMVAAGRITTAAGASTALTAVAVRTCPQAVVLMVGAEVLTEADTANPT